MGNLRRIINVPKSAFFPPPKVDSTVIHIDVFSQEALKNFFGDVSREKYFSIVRTAFAGKRKQLKNSLRSLCADQNILENALKKAKIKPSGRPEELGIEDWIRLVSTLDF